MTRTRVMTVGGIAVLAAVGMVGCSRQAEVVAQPMLDPATVSNTTYSDDRAAIADMPAYATRPQVRTITSAEPVEVQAESYRESETTHVERRKTSSHRAKKDRPFSHSVAIVGGSAGAGAVIGALAGGGKGAGIGALAGGGAGLVYDRMTHKRRD